MNTTYAFPVRLPATTPPAIQLSLHRTLERGGATVQEPLESKSLGIDWTTFVATVQDIGQVACPTHGGIYLLTAQAISVHGLLFKCKIIGMSEKFICLRPVTTQK